MLKTRSIIYRARAMTPWEKDLLSNLRVCLDPQCKCKKGHCAPLTPALEVEAGGHWALCGWPA